MPNPLSSWRRAVVPLVALAVLIPATLSGASNDPPLPPEDLERAEAVLRSLGWGYGTTVDGDDVRRLADHYGIGVGSVVDPEDLTRVLDAAGAPARQQTATPSPATAPPPSPTPQEPPTGREGLVPYFRALGIGYGTSVDDADVRILADRLGINVGVSVDDADIERLAQAAADHLLVRYPPFATVGGVTLRLPSDAVELVGFHESNHDGARQLIVVPGGTRKMTLPTRDRGTGSRSAADIVSSPSRVIRAPVTGRVLRGGNYTLYCDHTDGYVVIEPDGHPGWEVKVLHITGVQVGAGDRVSAGATVIARHPTELPFRSQVDRYTADRNWPHVHVEVVDPSIPDRPSPGGGC